MPCSRILRCEAEWSDSASSGAESTITVVSNPDVGVPTLEPLAFSAGYMGEDSGQGTFPPAPNDGGDPEMDTTATAVTSRARGARYTEPTVPFPPQKCPNCSLTTVFDTHNAFALHLKKKHRSYWCPKLNRCLSLEDPRSRRGEKGGVRLALRPLSAGPPRSSPPRPLRRLSRHTQVPSVCPAKRPCP